MPKSSRGFTLIEILVSVMIISVVIGSLLQLFSTNSHTFSSIEQKIKHTNTTTLLLGNPIYGYEDKTVDLAELVKDFNVDDELRRKLKSQKVEIIYSEVKSFDFSDAAETLSENDLSSSQANEGDVTDASQATTSLEVGKTTMKTEKYSSSFLRIKLQ